MRVPPALFGVRPLADFACGTSSRHARSTAEGRVPRELSAEHGWHSCFRLLQLRATKLLRPMVAPIVYPSKTVTNVWNGSHGSGSGPASGLQVRNLCDWSERSDPGGFTGRLRVQVSSPALTGPAPSGVRCGFVRGPSRCAGGVDHTGSASHPGRRSAAAQAPATYSP